jgi:hypothetical protein
MYDSFFSYILMSAWNILRSDKYVSSYTPDSRSIAFMSSDKACIIVVRF